MHEFQREKRKIVEFFCGFIVIRCRLAAVVRALLVGCTKFRAKIGNPVFAPIFGKFCLFLSQKIGQNL